MRWPLLARRRSLLSLVALLAVAGCSGNAPSRFYSLSSLPGPAGPPGAANPAAGPTVAVGPVQLPEYLNRPQIVRRTAPNEFQLGEFHQWAGPLEEDVSRVLAENLSLLLPTERVVPFSWRTAYPIDYRVQVLVVRFEADAAGEVNLVAHWSVVGKDGRTILRAGQYGTREAAGRQDYDAVVAAMSRALAGLSRAIATALQALLPA